MTELLWFRVNATTNWIILLRRPDSKSQLRSKLPGTYIRKSAIISSQHSQHTTQAYEYALHSQTL